MSARRAGVLSRSTRLPSALVLVWAAATALAGCSTQPPSPYGHDLGEGPGSSDLDDSEVCAPYPGGTLSGDDLLVLVNKQPGYQLSSTWAPADLVKIPPELMMPGRSDSLRWGVLQAFEDMVQAARDEAGLTLVARSAYRSFTTQCWTFASKVAEHGLEHARIYSAEPGRSQHQLGTTVDITSPALGYVLSEALAESGEGPWMAANAYRFGFALAYPDGYEDVTGYAYEPWHFRYIGLEAAQELHDSGEILEVYLERCDAGDPGLRCPREILPSPEINQGWIGGACTSDDDCSLLGEDAYCLTEEDGYPGGSCTRPCTGVCPDLAGAYSVSACVAAVPEDSCHSRCDVEHFPETGCRDGYQCVDALRPQGDAVPVCLPAY